MNKIFATKGIMTQDHFLVGTEWSYGASVVTMFNEGFGCNCAKKPRKPCKHITNVKLRLYGTFEEHYAL